MAQEIKKSRGYSKDGGKLVLSKETLKADIARLEQKIIDYPKRLKKAKELLEEKKAILEGRERKKERLLKDGKEIPERLK